MNIVVDLLPTLLHVEFLFEYYHTLSNYTKDCMSMIVLIILIIIERRPFTCDLIN